MRAAVHDRFWQSRGGGAATARERARDFDEDAADRWRDLAARHDLR